MNLTCISIYGAGNSLKVMFTDPLLKHSCKKTEKSDGIKSDGIKSDGVKVMV